MQAMRLLVFNQCFLKYYENCFFLHLLFLNLNSYCLFNNSYANLITFYLHIHKNLCFSSQSMIYDFYFLIFPDPK